MDIRKVQPTVFYWARQPTLGHPFDCCLGSITSEVSKRKLGPLCHILANRRIPVCSCDAGYAENAIEDLRMTANVLCESVAITSRNSGTVRTRTVGSSLYNMAVQTSNIISSQVSSMFGWNSSGLGTFSYRAANRSIGMTTNHYIAEAIKFS